ncbi:Transmembrane protein [Trema orientale]|uniref:Transmembrane protein n=1 Tax=Trema orientale TaxID=63057 RepID=A0A2P5B5L2_TREOI|nr:Transmembrane protein [Trema orientale]
MASPSNVAVEKNNRMEASVYWAAEKGEIQVFMEKINELHLDQLLTPDNNTILHVHARASTTDKIFVREILNMCPPLLLQTNAKGETPLHVAARYGHVRIVKALIKHAKSSDRQQIRDLESAMGRDSEATKQMLRMRNKEKDTALHEAVRFRRLEVVRILIKEDPHYSYSANEEGETPLYIAVEGRYRVLVDDILDKCSSPASTGPNGRTVLHAAIMARDKGMTRKLLEKTENLTRKADDCGYIPLHYAALLPVHVDIVKLLLEKDVSSAYVQNGIGMTALHIAANSSHVGCREVMKEIILRCPDSCEVVDHEGQNFLHFAVRSSTYEALQLILNHSSLGNYLLNAKDNAGNTPFLWMAANSHWKESILNAFLSHPHVNKMAFNKEKKNFLDMVTYSYGFKKKFITGERMKNKYGIRPHLRTAIGEDDEESHRYLPRFLKVMEKSKEIILVVATLIATVTFTAGFTLPGGYQSSKGPLQGAAILRGNAAFQAFVITDTVALGLSISAVLINLIMRTSDDKWKIIGCHVMSWYLTVLALVFMLIAFITGTYAVLAPSLLLAIATCVVGLLFLCLSFFWTRIVRSLDRFFIYV